MGINDYGGGMSVIFLNLATSENDKWKRPGDGIVDEMMR